MDEDEMEALVIILTRHRGGLKKLGLDQVWYF
jgi:hypothetical protein